MIRLDTHVVVWLFAGDVGRLSPAARELIEREQSLISPAVELELTFLGEIDRITVSAQEIIDDLGQRIGLERSTSSFRDVVGAAHRLTWTRDPFDRLIVGDAVATSSQLVTKDRHIRERCDFAVW